MAKKIFWTGMLAMVLAFGLAVVGCDDGSTDGNGGNGNTEPRKITITGITGKDGMEAEVLVFMDYDNDDITAMGIGNVSNGSVSFSLIKDEDLNPFTGSGSYYLYLTFFSDNVYGGLYLYTNGKTPTELGLTENSSEADIYAKLPKYNVSSVTSSIAFSQFKLSDLFPFPRGEDE